VEKVYEELADGFSASIGAVEATTGAGREKDILLGA
jgi:hypothetical protein